ncbi:hypothetical protein NSK11_contig00023-0012 [Nocardia seriolae]|uniref:Transposase n=1 Tax=Nocardia seriolae TaxID=37332 RepID=A0ABC9YQW4_9NOCA|nr:hypothetical protein NSERKGN1266_48260 [Nocardia seriolae]BEK96169.1 hypothetical protein NSER024013_40750 [Nocardia seriolae]GAM45799.1 hypothetical protein NS07_v2contig00019-0072 [Nocardia seriolae]GAP27763.1 hypothetical protein NSK11_contig00023-0012 [Nocardia seriolae]GEM23398.1 hypothetical protein NS2_16370 [Nocardia seriolae NBRC 15557]
MRAMASVAKATNAQKYPDQAAKRFRLTHPGVVGIRAAYGQIGRSPRLVDEPLPHCDPGALTAAPTGRDSIGELVERKKPVQFRCGRATVTVRPSGERRTVLGASP